MVGFSRVVLLVALIASNATAGILASAEVFAVLAGATVTNTGPTKIRGDLGVSPGTAITGFLPGNVDGIMRSNDQVTAQAQLDLSTAYNYLSSLPVDLVLTNANLGGLTLTSGVYKFTSTADLTGILGLNGPGQFVFQIGTSFNVANNSSIEMTGGAVPSNVYFQVGSSATIGANTALTGNIVTLQSISFGDTSTLAGRALAINGAVTLQSDSISVSSVPEPDTFTSGSLSAIALGCVLFARKARLASTPSRLTRSIKSELLPQ